MCPHPPLVTRTCPTEETNDGKLPLFSRILVLLIHPQTLCQPRGPLTSKKYKPSKGVSVASKSDIFFLSHLLKLFKIWFFFFHFYGPHKISVSKSPWEIQPMEALIFLRLLWNHSAKTAKQSCIIKDVSAKKNSWFCSRHFGTAQRKGELDCHVAPCQASANLQSLREWKTGVNTAWELSRAEDDARKFPSRASPFSPPTPKAVSCLCTESFKPNKSGAMM